MIIICRGENTEQIQNLKSNDLIKEYENFTHQKSPKQRSGPSPGNFSENFAKNRRSEEEEKINELENLLTTISVHINDTDKGAESGATSITQSDAAEDVTTEEIPTHAENVTTAVEDGPNSLGLTSDSHVKRGVLPELPQDDGNNSKDIISHLVECLLTTKILKIFFYKILDF